MKICKDCHREKPLKAYYGVQNNCKDCYKKAVRKNRLNKIDKYRSYDKKRQRENYERMFRHRYANMKARIEGRATRRHPVEGKELLSLDDFLIWCNQEENFSTFKNLHKTWKKNNFARNLTPSIDRIDDNVGYTGKNIQWVSLKQNIKNYVSNGSIHSDYYRKRDNLGRFIPF